MRLAALVIAVSLFACARKPSAGPADASVEDLGPIDWQTFAFNGVAIVTSHGDGQTCVVTCEGRGGRLLWRRDECVAGRDDLRFISPDCEVLLVLKDAPQVKGSVAASPVGAVWRGTNVETPLRLHQVANAERGVKVSDSGKWFGWLAGTLEYEGAKPRYSTSGKGVEFESLDGEHHALTFDELARWVDRLPEPPVVADAAAPVAAAPAPLALFRWTGADGIEQIGTEDQIPAKYRARAKPIQAELAVVRAEATDAGARDGGVDAGVDAGAPAVSQCTVWREKLSAIERELSALQPPEPCPNEAMKLQNGLAPFGAEERLKCRTTWDERVKAYETRKAKLESDRGEAQDALRKAQVSGC